MDQNQRPHSRKKTVSSGSVNVGRTDSVGSSNGPVGFGGRKRGSSRPQSSYSVPTQDSSGGNVTRAGGFSLKKLLFIAIIAIVAIFLLKSFSGGGTTSLLNETSEAEPVAATSDDGLLFSNLFGGGSSPLSSLFGGSSGDSSSADSYSSYAKPDYTVSKLARKKRYVPVGNGKDTVTVMVYMCGTDLESKYGMATKDLNEMLSATLSSNVNLIVETGGCKKWKNNTISSSKNQIYKIENNKMKVLSKDAGTAAMTDPKNLTTFIKFCNKNFPADRNILILWDHGGGSLTGYGYDEKNPLASSMPLNKFDSALKAAGCEFDFIGFDACLMATLETALVCNNYADYLIGSEETEPGTGWYYKNWLTQLSKNTSISTVDLGKTIIDDYLAACGTASGTTITLSLTDLAEMEGTVPDTFRTFSTATTKMISSDDYKKVSDARAGVRQFSAQNKLNQIDLADLANRLGTKEASSLEKALHGCVKYNKSTASRCNGLSIFFPYESTKNVKSALASLKAIGVDDEYTKCIKSFASLEYGGQIAGAASQLPDLSSMGGDLLGSLISSYTGGGASAQPSVSPLASLAGAFLGGGNSGNAAPSNQSGSLLGSLAGNLLGGGSSQQQSSGGSLLGSLFGGGSSQQQSSSGGSLLGSLAGGLLGSSAGNGLDIGTVASLLGAFSGKSMPAEYDWVDTDLIAEKAEDIAEEFINPARLAASEKDGNAVLELTDEEWALIQKLELNVFVKDGDGYIDMGLDNTFDWYDDTSVLLDFDGTWLTINGKACAYYLVSDTKQDDGSWTTIGRIPALLNGEFVNLQVVFDKAHPDGTVTGAYPLYEDDENVDVQAKGDIEIKAGDKIELLCDYYDLDGNYSESYKLGTSFTVPASGLKITNLKLNAKDISATFRATDIYGNYYWIPIN